MAEKDEKWANELMEEEDELHEEMQAEFRKRLQMRLQNAGSAVRQRRADHSKRLHHSPPNGDAVLVMMPSAPV